MDTARSSQIGTLDTGVSTLDQIVRALSVRRDVLQRLSKVVEEGLSDPESSPAQLLADPAIANKYRSRERLAEAIRRIQEALGTPESANVGHLRGLQQLAVDLSEALGRNIGAGRATISGTLGQLCETFEIAPAQPSSARSGEWPALKSYTA